MVCHKLSPVISNTQHGFLKGRSTVTISVIGDIENGRQVDGVFTDFSKDPIVWEEGLWLYQRGKTREITQSCK
jgi:hypothetical protein